MSELVNGFDVSIVDKKVLKVGPAGIDIAYQRLGNPDAPLVAGVRRPEGIPGAELVLIEGMGHNLPAALHEQLATRIADLVWRSERS